MLVDIAHMHEDWKTSRNLYKQILDGTKCACTPEDGVTSTSQLRLPPKSM